MTPGQPEGMFCWIKMFFWLESSICEIENFLSWVYRSYLPGAMSSAAPKGLLGAAVAKAKAAKATSTTTPPPSAMSIVPVPKPGVAAPGLRVAPPPKQFASSMAMVPTRTFPGAPLATPSASAYLGFAWLLILINFINLPWLPAILKINAIIGPKNVVIRSRVGSQDGNTDIISSFNHVHDSAKPFT